jgi:DNA repair protein RadC
MQIGLPFKENATKLEKNQWQVSEVELVYKRQVPFSRLPKIKSSSDSYALFLSHWDENKIQLIEQFKILLLNRANTVLAISDISTGGMTGTVVDPKIILATAIKMNATAIILAHNHPGGNLIPSQADLMLTRKIKEAAAFHDLLIFDHIIVTSDGYYSFADDGTL